MGKVWSPIVTAILFIGDVDVITLGNHAYRHREVWPYLDERDHILRPANFLATQPGHGTCVVERDGASLGVVNLSGNLFMQAVSPALVAVDDALREGEGADHVLVDMHAEATSEKIALGWYLEGRVTAVVGTHTHVPTADARVLPGGTAYITDVGMTGARGGVIGVRREQSIAVMRSHMPQRYDAADGDRWIQAKWFMTIGTTSFSDHCSRASAESGPVPTHISEPSESLACSEPCE